MPDYNDIDIDVPETWKEKRKDDTIVNQFRGKWINAEVLAEEIVKELDATEDVVVNNFLYQVLDLIDEISVGQEVLTDVVTGKTRKITMYMSENPNDTEPPIRTKMTESYFHETYIELPNAYDYDQTVSLEKNLDLMYKKLNDPVKNPLEINRLRTWVKENVPDNYHLNLTYGDVVQTHGRFFIYTKDGFKTLNIS